MKMVWFFCAVGVLASSAQTIEQTAGIYYAYPGPQQVAYTPAPDGYKPCYISHYGRHGSRWITEDVRYTRVAETLDSLNSLNELTKLGKDVRMRVHRATDDALGRGGQLTPLGEKQHRGIAKRMAANYPEVFDNGAKINAVSSTSQRCILSMNAFLLSLVQNNPQLEIGATAYPRDMEYIAYTSPAGQDFSSAKAPWRLDYIQWVDSITNPERLMQSLMVYPDNMAEGSKRGLMMDLYWLASDMQNVELDEDFYDIFTYDELRNIWRTINARMYVCNGNSPLSNDVMPECATNLLTDIITKADSCLDGKSDISANLRFGHDTHLLRLLSLMEIDGCANQETDINKYHQAWTDYELSPMAANLQIIFYKKSDNPNLDLSDNGPILVKLLLNEKEVTLPLQSPIAPYYTWEQVKSFWKAKTTP